ncbi:family A G protein-coupled receptor-like protein [Daldinia caldariorum]|uniref:family A G protein-coupled receptor-like protein n=1 Tax=Daldinia caldariorum TaxID=326644 RepID=UPI0020087D81|nr:family A G protein-coupled receptor-like protein [Daldinia caldariorum]KAI1471603.1 family A G protein-coupled receptor-like protein [Daldinia caldariorum]
MAIIFRRVNEALDINTPAGDEELSVNGSDWLWAATAIYLVSFIILYATSFVARSGEKIFHYLFTIALLVGSISYYAIASDLAYVVIPVVNHRPGDPWTRQIFWAEYVNWVVSFPVVTIALGLLSGVSWATILYNVALAWTWVVSYLVAAFTASNYKWGFYAFGTVAWLLLAFSTLFHGTTSARRVNVAGDHSLLAGWVNFLWLLYPIAWGLSDGGNRIGVTPAYIFFGLLDVLLVPVLSFAFVILSRKWDYNTLNLAFTRYGRVHQGGEFPEKTTTAPTAPVVGEQAA